MDWQRYKQLCDRPDYWSRWMIEQTAELLQRAGELDLTQQLLDRLCAAPVEKPDDHRTLPATDMFPLQLSVVNVQRILAVVEAAAAAGWHTAGTRGRGLGGFRAAWAEYLRELERAVPGGGAGR